MDQIEWIFSIPNTGIRNYQITRELIDLPQDVYLRIKRGYDKPDGAEISIRIEIVRADNSHDIIENMWTGELPYYGYGRLVIVTISCNSIESGMEGRLHIAFQNTLFTAAS
ncbi:hypothetical protein WOC76_12590 [Methylocystis sp. IM3]|uniref:hypothetical protein n=1 Tax=unclassified Methylocystis TaxID=2625913 RepID=UPI0030FB3099